jgi:hypothetical protein
MLLGTAQSLIDCIFAGGIAIEARDARDLLNIPVMPIDLGTGGLDLLAPAALPAGMDLSAMILSRRFDTGDRSARFGIGIGIGLGLDFPNFTLLE